MPKTSLWINVAQKPDLSSLYTKQALCDNGRAMTLTEQDLQGIATLIQESEARTGELINAFASNVDERFEAIDERFETIDERFEAIDKRFEAIEKKIESAKSELRNEISSLKYENSQELASRDEMRNEDHLALAEDVQKLEQRVTRLEQSCA